MEPQRSEHPDVDPAGADQVQPGVAVPDPSVTDPVRPPTEEDPRFLDPSATGSGYAVPLSTLMAGAFVASTDQVQLHPDPPLDRPEHLGGGAVGGGSADGE